MEGINLNTPEILSSSEACFLWGIDDSWLRKKASEFPEGTIRRVGKQWIVTTQGMFEVFGEPSPKQRYSKSFILNNYHELQKLIQKHQTLSTTERIKLCMNHLETHELDKTFTTSLVEAAIERYNLDLLLEIFTTKGE